MASGDLTQSYEPNAALRYLYRRFFDHIRVDESWVQTVRRAANRGSVVYVLRNVSFIDFLALDHLTKRFNLPQIRFAQEMGLGVLEPLGRGWWRALVPGASRASSAERLSDALGCGGSAALFLKRAPTLLEQGVKPGRRTRAEGDELLRALLQLQRGRERPILLVPQAFVWTKRPDKRDTDLLDLVFGRRDYPGRTRTVVQFLANYRQSDFRAGEELDLSAVLRDAAPGEDDGVLVRRATYALLTRLERERRAILGPAKKPADRMRDEILRSPKLQSIINDMAGSGRRERFVLTAKAYRMLRELEAVPELDAHRAFEVALDLIVHKIYAGIEVDEEGIGRVREAAKRGTVVFLPSHKSHVDYLMLSYVLNSYHLQLPLIAAGDNLSFFPMGPIFRRGGAFFIRRSFKGDRLYAAVVDAYLRKLVREGWALEFFLEGGRSRTGKLLQPKFGLLNIVCDAALSLPDSPVTFVPVSIGYDRIVEERSYVRELTGGEKRREDARALLRGTRVLGGFYGRVNVQFGETLSLERVREELRLPAKNLSPAQRRSLVTRLGYQAMGEINRVTSVTPGAVVATALLAGGRRGVAHNELLHQCRQIVAALGPRQARTARTLVTSSGALRPDAVREAAQLFARGDLLSAHVPGAGDEPAVKARAAIYTGEDVIYSVPDDKRLLLSLSKNIIVHFFVEAALVATALRMVPGAPVPEAELGDRVRALSRLFKHEFLFRADASFDQIFADALGRMVEAGELARDEAGAIVPGPGHDGFDGVAWVAFYADVLVPYLEGYRVAARAVQALLKGPLSPRDLLKRALVVGERMFLAGEIGRREAISRSILENALRSLDDQQALRTVDGKITLRPPFDSPETITGPEARIRTFLGEPPEAGVGVGP
ncbi:MAG: 1-acyl-sn-glycerol-3-phosphate acyltransferase [Polyangiaceae bacterium]|nr:1-acyl-sn-glycerol-3-phosphate acyltransferase [Polyangiaceae bacterium]